VSADLKKAYREHLEEQLLDRTRVSEDTICPKCAHLMRMTFKTPRTTTFLCEQCNHRLSRQTLR
jgi:hypothetical protein